ncbi:MAG: response regulator [Methanothrix sp.]|nr:MAG: response regulator [Methanothrix sp.]
MIGNFGVSGLHILLAEDDALNMKVLQLMLRHMGCSVDTASNGFEVLLALERQSYDIILMNICMPRMDGLTATKIIRQRLPNERLKIIALTASGFQGFREKCLEAGMDDYVSKPVKMGELAEMLRKYWPLHYDCDWNGLRNAICACDARRKTRLFDV